MEGTIYERHNLTLAKFLTESSLQTLSWHADVAHVTHTIGPHRAFPRPIAHWLIEIIKVFITATRNIRKRILKIKLISEVSTLTRLILKITKVVTFL